MTVCRLIYKLNDQLASMPPSQKRATAGNRTTHSFDHMHAFNTAIDKLKREDVSIYNRMTHQICPCPLPTPAAPLTRQSLREKVNALQTEVDSMKSGAHVFPSYTPEDIKENIIHDKERLMHYYIDLLEKLPVRP